MLTIIVISYNSEQVLTHCLGPLIGSDTWPVAIIDNASTDGSGESLRKRFPGATIISLPQNIGYGRAANVGLRMVETPYALLLNPDLSVGPEEVEKLLNHARTDTSKAAIWGPASQRKDFTGKAPQSVEWISGCAMLFDMEKLQKTGFFDENIFLFFEETDLCGRVRDAGYEVMLCRDVFFDHLLGQASMPNPAIERMKNWHYGWSRCYYFEKRGQHEGNRSPKRQFAQYRFKSWVATHPKKRMKYKAQAEGAKAFLNGEKAFLPDGTPQRMQGLQCRQNHE